MAMPKSARSVLQSMKGQVLGRQIQAAGCGPFGRTIAAGAPEPLTSRHGQHPSSSRVSPAFVECGILCSRSIACGIPTSLVAHLEAHKQLSHTRVRRARTQSRTGEPLCKRTGDRDKFILVPSFLHHVLLRHRLQSLVEAFHCPICLGVVGGSSYILPGHGGVCRAPSATAR